MNRRRRVSAYIARSIAVSACLALVALVLFRAIRPREGIPARIAQPSFIDEVEGIVIEGPRAGIPLVFRKTDGTWFLYFGSDKPFPADAGRIAGLLEALRERRRVRRLPESNEYSQGTVGQGSCRITLVSRDESVAIAFGSESAGGRWRYARKEGDRSIIAFAGDLSPWLDNASAPWLERRPFALLSRYPLSRAAAFGDGYYFAVEDDASLEKVSGLLAGLSVVDLTNIPPDPTMRLRLERGDATVTSISVTRLDGEVAIVTDETRGLSWVVAADELLELVLAFQHFSAM